MFTSIALDLAAFAAAIYLLSPLAVRWTFRVTSHCHPSPVSPDSLPPSVAALFGQRIPEIQELGFELLGCFDCGCLANETHSYLAYFCNRRTNECASISVMATPASVVGYLEFSTRFTSGLTIETNTNDVLPLTSSGPDTQVFRFSNIRDVRTLLHTHHRLMDKHAPGLSAEPEPRGEEIQRYVRAIENYGPRHARIGQMRPTEDGQSYKLTWKGAYLMTWRGLWPVSLLRRWLAHQKMQSELRSLEAHGLTTLQKARLGRLGP